MAAFRCSPGLAPPTRAKHPSTTTNMATPAQPKRGATRWNRKWSAATPRPGRPRLARAAGARPAANPRARRPSVAAGKSSAQLRPAAAARRGCPQRLQPALKGGNAVGRDASPEGRARHRANRRIPAPGVRIMHIMSVWMVSGFDSGPDSRVHTAPRADEGPDGGLGWMGESVSI